MSVAATLIIGLPLAAFLVAPTASAQVGAAPGSGLAGLNTSATAVAVQISPLTPGLVGAGNLTQGNLVEADMPYASSTVSTGPSTSGVASPVYPGPTAADAGNAVQTFSSSVPPQLVSLLNDHVLAESDYPAQLTAGTSSSYAPPGGSAVGAGTASTQSGPAATTATASLNDTSVGGAFDFGSSTSSTGATVQAASVATTADTEINHITIAGVIQIAGISSTATASSNGTVGQENSTLHIGAVTILGLYSAYIGPNGIRLVSSDQGGLAVVALNEVLGVLQQLGLTVTTIAPSSQQNGQSASVTSAAVQVGFLDAHIPNPEGEVPLSSVGLDVDLGLSQASADATALPPFVPFPSIATPPSTPAVVTPVTTAKTVASGSVISTSGSSSVSTTTSVPAAISSAPSPAVAAPVPVSQTPSSSFPAVTPASFLGLPVRVAWVVIAVLLSIVAAGPLLGYANWQLLRGRTP